MVSKVKRAQPGTGLNNPVFSCSVVLDALLTGASDSFRKLASTARAGPLTWRKERCTLRPEKNDYLRGLAVSADGRHLAFLKQESASPYRHVVQILDAITGRVLRTVAADHSLPRAKAAIKKMFQKSRRTP